MDAVDVVKKVYACYEKGDLDGVAELCTPDTVWTTRSNIPAGSVPWIGTHRGPEAVKTNFLGAMGMATNLDKWEIYEYVQDASNKNRAVAFGVYAATLKDDQGNPVDGANHSLDFAMLWTIRDGKVATYDCYNDNWQVLDAWNTARGKAK